jgi:hypothetical protein
MIALQSHLIFTALKEGIIFNIGVYFKQKDFPQMFPSLLLLLVHMQSQILTLHSVVSYYTGCKCSCFLPIVYWN